MSLEEMTCQVRKHGELTVATRAEAQRLEAYAFDTYGHSFGLRSTVAGTSVIDLDA